MPATEGYTVRVGGEEHDGKELRPVLRFDFDIVNSVGEERQEAGSVAS